MKSSCCEECLAILDKKSPLEADAWKYLCEHSHSPYFLTPLKYESFFVDLEQWGYIVTLETNSTYLGVCLKGYDKNLDHYCVHRHFAKKKPSR